MEQQIDYKNVTKKVFNTFQEIRDDRIEFVIKSKESGFFNFLTQTLKELYSSHGHFIYELLQNAEDAKANNVKFELFEDKLIFSHDGSNLFKTNDIESITNAANSTKIKEGNAIGKFGIGFKSVFEYTDRPEIMSGEYHFEIDEILIPNRINDENFYKTTVFIFPFKNDLQKTAKTRKDEVEKTMFGLQTDTLLFLRNIKTIKCIFQDKELIINKRTTPTNKIQDLCVIESIKNFGQIPENNIETSDFYRFFKKIRLNVFNSEKNENEEKEIDIAIAYKKENDEIVPILSDNGEPNGSVYSFFPCVKEISNLCFHIHAPFAIPPNRENLKEDNKANDEIISEIGNLVCESIREFKKQDILKKITFLKVLPNDNDGDLEKYNIIRDKIYNLFNTEECLVMKDGQYGNAQGKFIGDTNEIQDLLPDTELNKLFDTANKTYWIKRPFGSGRDLTFLKGLVQVFSISDFVRRLDSLYQTEKYNTLIQNYSTKDIEWFKSLYISLNKSSYSKYDLKKHCLCLCEDNKLYPFNECYINTSVFEVNKHFIKKELFNCEDKKDGDSIRNFFNSSELEIKKYTNEEYFKDNVQSYAESKNKEVEDILLFYYEYKKDKDTVIKALKEKQIELKGSDGIWKNPEELFFSDEYEISLDNNNIIKYLDIYYKFYNQIHNDKPITKLSIEYFNISKSKEIIDASDKENFITFLAKLGVNWYIRIIRGDIRKNDNYSKICSEAEGNRGKGDWDDYKIEALDTMLQNIEDEKVFYFTWLNILKILPFSQFSSCKYRRAQKQDFKYYDSQIVNVLKKSSWIMQKDNGVISYVKPEDAIRSKLPIELLKDLDNENVSKWLKAIDFEKNKQIDVEKENQQNSILSEMGVKNPNVAKELIKNYVESEYINIPEEKKIEFLNKLFEEYKNKCQNYEEISREIDNETYKATENYAASEYANSPKIVSKSKDWKVRERYNDIEEYIREFLRDTYGNRKGSVKCQLCGEYMPFKRPNNKDYFEIIQLFRREILKKESKSNRVALCPTCAARYKVYMSKINKQKELAEQIINSQIEDTEFNLLLDKNMTLHFDKRHLAELKGVLKKQKEEDEK